MGIFGSANITIKESNMKELFVQNPIIPIVITLIAYIISYTIYIKTKLPILTPLVTSVILVGFSLHFMQVPYSVYNESGGKFINAMVGPATVALALPIYRNLPILKANLAVILISIAIGSSVGIIGIFISAKLLGISEALYPSLLTKSVTTAIAVDVTANMGGIKSITVLSGGICRTRYVAGMGGEPYCRGSGCRNHFLPRCRI